MTSLLRIVAIATAVAGREAASTHSGYDRSAKNGNTLRANDRETSES